MIATTRTFDWLPTSASDRLILSFSAVMFAFAAWMLVFYPFGAEWRSDAPVVGKVTIEGKVQRRHARVLQWEELAEESDLFLRDILYVPEGSTAEVTLKDGKKVLLEQESLVQFDQITLSEIEISLWEKVIQKRKRDKPVFRILPLPRPPKAGTLGDSITLAQAQADLTQKLRTYLSHKVVLAPVRAVKLRPIPKLKFVNLSDYAVKLVSPQDYSKVKLTGERWLSMEWSPVPMIGVTYELLVSRNSKFDSETKHSTQTTSVNVQFQDPGFYWWRVRARKGWESSLSEPYAFELVFPDAPKKAPKRGVAGKKP